MTSYVIKIHRSTLIYPSDTWEPISTHWYDLAHFGRSGEGFVGIVRTSRWLVCHCTALQTCMYPSTNDLVCHQNPPEYTHIPLGHLGTHFYALVRFGTLW